MTDLWLPAFTDLCASLANISQDELDIRSVARQANVSLATVSMPSNPMGSWEAVITAAQHQDRLLALHAVLAGRYREWPRVFAAISRSRESLLMALAAEAGEGSAAQARHGLLRDHVWREIGKGIPLERLAPELREMQSVASAGDIEASLEFGDAATAAGEGNGGEVVSRLVRARRAATRVADKVGAPLVTELLKRVLLPPA